MIERTGPQRSASCLGNGCGDFGFIEDLSTLIALKILVDDLDFEDHPSDGSARVSELSVHVISHSNSDLTH
jgi:hypothetical protein